MHVRLRIFLSIMSKPYIFGIVFFSFILIGGAYLLFASGNKPQNSIVSYSSQDKEKPLVEAKETAFDMGTIKVSDQKEKLFTIKNIGKKPLQLSEFTTSCGCTSISIITQGKSSDEFSMHAQSDYVANVAPKTEVKVKVIYRPYIMPVYGAVEREAYFSTNDPLNPKLVFKVKAFVK